MSSRFSMFGVSWQAAALPVVLALLCGCRAGGIRSLDSSTGMVVDASVRSFHVRGVIRGLSPAERTATVRHEAIAGYMPSMTMELQVKNADELRRVAVGDTVDFVLQVSDSESWIENLKRVEARRSETAAVVEPSVSALLQVAQSRIGDLLPDVELLGEDGRAVRLSQFRGQALALTFVFTRCPLPDFCPRMNRNFVRARELLTQRTGSPTNWQFLSISFDAGYDRPQVLARYATDYRGPNPDRWMFAAASADALAVLSERLDFRFVADGGSFVHNLRTVVLNPRGRISRHFEGNRWRAEDLADALAEAARQSE